MRRAGVRGAACGRAGMARAVGRAGDTVAVAAATVVAAGRAAGAGVLAGAGGGAGCAAGVRVAAGVGTGRPGSWISGSGGRS